MGSEMCIRDRTEGRMGRPGHTPATGRGRGGHAPRHLDRRLARPGGGLHRRCLLYTSDAADDLLCVDLGGRRIIKKKKQDNSAHAHQLGDR